jgi:hypothetical protein
MPLGLTEEQVKKALREQFSRHGIKTNDGENTGLYISAHQVYPAFMVFFAYIRPVLYINNDQEYLTTLPGWDIRNLYIYPNPSSQIERDNMVLKYIQLGVDKFIQKYRQVNHLSDN